VPPFVAVSFEIDRRTGALSKTAEASIPEYTPFITTDPTGRYLLGNAYHGNFVWVSAIETDGRIVAPPIQIVEKIRTSHSVMIHPKIPCAYVAVTGDHEIRKYAFDVTTGHLRADGTPSVMAKPQSRPRHMALHPNERFLYCNGETWANIAGYTIDETTGALTQFQDIDAWPANGVLPVPSTGADLHISPDGRFIYGSERAQSVISVYAIAPDGMLSYVQSIEAEQVPRAFRIDPSGRFLISAGQNSGRISVYGIDRGSGRLTRLHDYEAGSGASWVEFVTL
jgi:6-phosphogluconolactonase